MSLNGSQRAGGSSRPRGRMRRLPPASPQIERDFGATLGQGVGLGNQPVQEVTDTRVHQLDLLVGVARVVVGGSAIRN
jgi:hypothetical protein